MSVFNFLEKFQQNSLLANVNLSISSQLYREHLLPFLANFLPLIDTINSINLSDFTQLGQINNGCADIDGYAHMMMEMLARTRILEIRLVNYIWRNAECVEETFLGVSINYQNFTTIEKIQ
jgi:hypothetical protein